MASEKILSKIQKLLALSKSSNEHEAQSALLKARKLMAEHKLTESEIDGIKSVKIEECRTGIFYSARLKNRYYIDLAKVIAKKHCCGFFTYSFRNSPKKEITFNGFPEELAICKEVYLYAVDSINSEMKRIDKKFKSSTRINYTKEYIDNLKYSYSEGFVNGLDALYHEQDAELGWGLILSVPQEVNDIISEMKKVSNKGQVINRDSASYCKGLSDGKNFKLNERLS